MTDSVNKPNHYTFGKYECIDVIEVFDESMNPIHGGFVNTNIVIILRQ